MTDGTLAQARPARRRLPVLAVLALILAAGALVAPSLGPFQLMLAEVLGRGARRGLRHRRRSGQWPAHGGRCQSDRGGREQAELHTEEEWGASQIDPDDAPRDTPRAVREYLDTLEQAAFGAASEVQPKFISHSDPECR